MHFYVQFSQFSSNCMKKCLNRNPLIYITFTFPGRLKREIDPTKAKPESPPQSKKKPKPTRPRPNKYVNPIDNPAKCNGHNSGKNGKQCMQWARTKCIKGKDSGDPECNTPGEPGNDSGSGGIGAAGVIILIVLVFVHL